MVFFGHIGTTVAVAKAIEKGCPWKCVFDYRIILLGSILPDIIDKLIGRVFFNEVFSSGRLFAHTLLFTVVLFILGIVLWMRQRNKHLLVLAGCIFFHQLCDSMWKFPKIWLWSYWGLDFPRIGAADEWLNGVFHKLFSDPTYYLPELIGLCILMYYLLHRRNKIGTLIKTGKLE